MFFGLSLVYTSTATGKTEKYIESNCEVQFANGQTSRDLRAI